MPGESRPLWGASKREIKQTTEMAHESVHRHLRSLEGAQKELAEIAAGKSILVIDAGLEVPTRNIEKRLRLLRENKWHQMADLLVKKLLGGKVPESAAEFFSLFFGRDVNLINAPLDQTSVDALESSDAVVFSGSPGNVTDALCNISGEKKVREGFDVTHRLILERSKHLYKKAGELGLPVLGVCYGHQLVTSSEGGEITKMEAPRKKWEEIKPTEYGAELVAGTFADYDRSGKIGSMPVYHGDHAIANPERSAVILRSSDVDASIVHGVLHLSGTEEQFSGDPKKDAEIMRRILGEGLGGALTMQAHPELSGLHPFTEFVLTGSDSSFKEVDTLAEDMLALINNFLKSHKRFEQRKW